MVESLETSPDAAINLMLVSHTNVGKTTLVRTLLGRDVGEVLDAPDVTQAVEAHDLAEVDGAGVLKLWDTPGFGDSNRLAKRLRVSFRWLAWLLRDVWDRYRNPRLWRAQRVAQDLRERADVILYLVNSLERPVDAIYIAPELDVLGWTGKPVLVILNQGGDSRYDDQAAARDAEWRDVFARYPQIFSVLNLDSYSRCWLQELVLYEKIGRALPQRQRASYQKLVQRVRADHAKRFDESIDVLAEYLARLGGDRVEIATGWFSQLADLWDQMRKRVPWGSPDELLPHERAMADLAQQYANETRRVTDRLITIHRLSGVSAEEVVKEAGELFEINAPLDASTSALTGGVISGVLTGLGADLVSGGLTLGSGALAGAVLGAIGAAALSKGYNIYARQGAKVVGWSPNSLTDAFRNAVLLYLAVAHFGRGQGEWRRNNDPAYRVKIVDESIARHRPQLLMLWARAADGPTGVLTTRECSVLLTDVLVQVLSKLYPETEPYLVDPQSPLCLV